MASSDSDYDYTEDEDEEEDETEYSDDDDDDDDDDEGEEDDDSEYSLEDEDDEEEDEDEAEEEEGLAEGEEEEAEEESSSDSDDEDEQVPALEHGEQAEPDEISEGPDAPVSGISTPIDPIPEDRQLPSIQTDTTIQTDAKDLQMTGNLLSAATDIAPGGEGTITVSSLSTDLEKVKLDYPSSP